ncbi:MAG TPA: hypothetical protein VHE30_03805 [Polyangiaceae bacterium]|nr:hypothetical protein [Polyangiaceae bacterium]
MKRLAILVIVALFSAFARGARAQESVATCVRVDAPAADHDGLVALVTSEVDRHPSHHVVLEHCTAHLKVELIELGGDRFLTGRTAGEVPDRVRVEGKDGKALEKAVSDLLRVVLGSDPIALREPGGHSWFSDRILALRDHARNRFDFTALESGSIVSGSPAFLPGLAFAYSREIVDLQIGIEGMGFQNVESRPGRLELETRVRLHGVVSYFLSSTADVSGFVGATVGLEHQRFRGPRSAEAGSGVGTYAATGPALSLRAGVEMFRTTTARAFVLGEVVLPVFGAVDQDGEIVSGWYPAVNLGAGIGF